MVKSKTNVHSFFFIRNHFIRSEISGGTDFKKLESLDKGNLRNLVYIRFHEIKKYANFLDIKNENHRICPNIKKLIRL